MSKSESTLCDRDDYRQDLADMAVKIPAYKELESFLEESSDLDSSPAKITSVQFDDDLAPHFKDIPEAELSNHLEASQGSTLFVVENVSGHVIEVLGSAFRVDYEFWLNQISEKSWFRLDDIEKHLPALKSVQLESRSIRHRFIGLREALLHDPDAKIEDRLEPERGTTRAPRIAGGMTPLARSPSSYETTRPRQQFSSLVVTRQHASVWFDAAEGGLGWKTGILLLDAPFCLSEELGSCRIPAYRPFESRSDLQRASSYHDSLITCLQQNKILRKGGIPCPFVVLVDMYRIIASEWIVVNTYFQRELNTIEWCLEHEVAGIEQLDQQLRCLYKMKRRVTLYQGLIKGQRDACERHGRKYWASSPSPGSEHALDEVMDTLRLDFGFVTDLVVKNQARITKNIDLLMMLISVAEGRVGIANGKRMEALALAAMFLVPFSLVSSVMNISGNLGPGGSKQYLFWLISTPMSAILGLGYVVYTRYTRRISRDASWFV